MKTALVLVDIQNDYFPGGAMELHRAMAAGAAAKRLLTGYRKRDAVIVHVQHLSIRPGATFFLPGTVGAEIHADVAPQPGEAVVEKHYPNSFRETRLLEILRRHQVTHLVIAGMMTHMCIDTTVRAAFDLGFVCRVASDACATRALSHDGQTVAAEEVQTAYLAALGAVFAEVTTVDALCGD